ncbi:MAG: transglycosylase SLT domain-containing protein [Symbiobacteriia bacterium]
MITRRPDGGPADLPFWLWFGALVTLGLLFTALYLDKQATLLPPEPATTAQIEELNRQLDDLQRQSDDLGRRIEEDIRALQLRQRMIEHAQAAGTDPYWVDYAWDRAAEAGVDPALFVALIDQESGWNARLVHLNTNGTRDWGLVQVNDASLPGLLCATGGHDPLDPRDSIRMGAYKLAYLGRLYGGDADRIHRMLTGYNRGEGGLQTWLASRGTARSPYSRAVLARAEG